LNFELIPNEKSETALFEWAKPTWPQAFSAMMTQPMGPFGLRSRQENPKTLDGGTDSGEQR
jgi:hypothetical protein